MIMGTETIRIRVVKKRPRILTFRRGPVQFPIHAGRALRGRWSSPNNVRTHLFPTYSVLPYNPA